MASALKLYLLELPDSLVSSHVYEIVKTVYSSAATDTSEESRVAVIQSTLGQLRLANIATLDAITTHFTRLIELTSAEEGYIASLATNLAPCILRPRTETSLTMNEKYNYRLLRDLFGHKEAIFGELKRASSAAGRQANETRGARGRGLSTDERGRQLAEQERYAAIAANKNQNRTSSPTANSRMKRERSPNRMSGDATTRFPVSPSASSPPSVTSSNERNERRSTISRHSLEVPGSAEGSPVEVTRQNGSAVPVLLEDTLELGKRDSFTRGSRVTSRKPANLARQSLYGGHRDSTGSIKDVMAAEEQYNRPHGVQLQDKPMDD